MLEKDLITCQQAAEILGRSPSTISRALAQGRLKYADPTRKLLLRQGLELRFANATRPKADCPQKVKRDDKAAERVALIPDPPGRPTALRSRSSVAGGIAITRICIYARSTLRFVRTGCPNCGNKSRSDS